MIIESLAIKDFRVLAQLELELKPGLNLIWGDNGAGKTSILEAVFLASRGRSFRHREAGPYIRSGCDYARVVVRSRDETGQHHVLGIQRSARDQQVRYDGESLSRRSAQVRALPLQLLTPNSHALIEGAPELRRRYLDLGLFHVEQDYHRRYGEYQRALRQRNAALRSQPKVARSWDKSLSDQAQWLDGVRHEYVTQLSEAATEVLGGIAPGLSVELHYRRGWDTDVDLSRLLADRWESDLRQGFTGQGPHRADIQIRAERADASKRLSRGQQKLVVLALMLGQVRLLQIRSGIKQILLLDDLPAELDRTHRERVVNELERMAVQALITTVDPDSLPKDLAWGVFHVEHGGRLSG